MDAIEFVKEEIRMCASCQDCTDCPLCNTIYCNVYPKERKQEEAAEIVRRVEEWSAVNPRKTCQDVFLEHYPDALLDYGIINIKPCQLIQNYTYRDCSITDCPQCRKEYWMQKLD